MAVSMCAGRHPISVGPGGAAWGLLLGMLDFI